MWRRQHIFVRPSSSRTSPSGVFAVFSLVIYINTLVKFLFAGLLQVEQILVRQDLATRETLDWNDHMELLL
jgi:hypothetical protein